MKWYAAFPKGKEKLYAMLYWLGNTREVSPYIIIKVIHNPTRIRGRLRYRYFCRKYTTTKKLQVKINSLPLSIFGAFTSDVNHWIQDLQDTAEAKGLYFPEIHRKFKIIWRENITFSIARHTACAAFNAIEKHRYNSSLMSVNWLKLSLPIVLVN